MVTIDVNVTLFIKCFSFCYANNNCRLSARTIFLVLGAYPIVCFFDFLFFLGILKHCLKLSVFIYMYVFKFYLFFVIILPFIQGSSDRPIWLSYHEKRLQALGCRSTTKSFWYRSCKLLDWSLHIYTRSSLRQEKLVLSTSAVVSGTELLLGLGQNLNGKYLVLRFCPWRLSKDLPG